MAVKELSKNGCSGETFSSRMFLSQVLCVSRNLIRGLFVFLYMFHIQVVLWDIKKYSELLKNHRTHGQGGTTNQNMANLVSLFMRVCFHL